MLDGAGRLLLHDVTQARQVRILDGRGIGDGEVPARVIAVQEDGDVVYLARAVFF